MTCLLVTLLVFCSWYLFLSVVAPDLPLRKLLLSFLFASSQIVLTELILGVFHVLYLSPLMVINLTIAMVLIGASFRHRLPCSPYLFEEEFLSLRKSLPHSRDGYTTLLAFVAILAYSWILAASYLLPPRGVDDLTYHLPVIFEYIQSHEIRLMPVALRHHFAFPQNAELLFMWPTIFAHNQRMVDGLNVPFVLMSVLAIYALFRHFHIPRNESFLAALLYALCPVVIMQAGVSYIDIVVSFYLLLGIFFSLLFHAHGRVAYLAAAGTCVGMLLGMKYTALLLIMPLQALIVPGLVRGHRKNFLAYILPILLLCGFWYSRNLFVLRDPFFPLNFLGPLLGTQAEGEGGILQNVVVNGKQWVSRYLIDDVGIGTYDGGFGLVFWGIAFPSWLYIAGYYLLHPRKAKLSRCILLAYLPIGFLLLLAVPRADVNYTARLAMFIVPVGLFAFCETLKILDDKVGSLLLKTACILLSLAGLSLMFSSNQPSYRLGRAIGDRKSGIAGSDFRYLEDALPTQAALRYIWEPLDFLTIKRDKGFRCRIVSETRLFAPAPVYGTNLQNRVMYAPDETAGPPDALIYTYYLTAAKEEKAVAPDSTVTEAPGGCDLLSSGRYVLVSHSERGYLLLRSEVLADPRTQGLLRQYYHHARSGAVARARLIAPLLSEDIPVVTSSMIGYGLRALEQGAGSRIIMTPGNMEGKVASGKHIDRCYTLDSPLPGYRARAVSSIREKRSFATVYLNERQ